MDFSEQEKWICIMTIFETSQYTKLLPKVTRQTLEEMLRKKFCQSVDYKKWLEIEQNIIKTSKDVQGYYLEMALKSMGKTQITQEELDQVKSIETQLGNNYTTDYLKMIKTFLPTGENQQNKKIIELIDEISRHDGK